ncbi:Gfo/Idh/MocA family protein [Alienimonas chondri]|uniref:Inositol 2-dehydrogenase/D-chiro-inositol 3-dehydrogenase n=1 Tax=Alienimonas chondri TaxID=2681879 RepID=A0ABX1VII2_9PLAN|nr:Gfo/Idh/MocA family oxidoreductase [Alienimonas chondri]NNJ27246.1 Inositol 2-dehydrogenase/D-chiro-inositol 3-dehydrogenase [Alienimonas chondri]
MTSLSRRKFVQSSSALAAGLSMTGGAARAGRVSAPGGRAVRVAVMGMSRGLDLAKAFAGLPGVTVATVCDVDAGRLDRAVKTVSALSKTPPNAATDVREVLKDPDLDALLVAAPNFWHTPAALLALEAGKHVYVEKPCCHTPAEGERLVAAARKTGLCVQHGTQRRSEPAIVEGVELVRGGEIGDVFLARAWYANGRGPVNLEPASDPPASLNYDLWQGPAPRAPYRSGLIPYNWHWFWDYGNGELGNNGIHALDLARWGLDAEFPESVVCAAGRYAWDDDQQTPDTYQCAWTFPGGKQMTWEGLSCNKLGVMGDGFGVTFHGKDGSVQLTSGGYRLFDRQGKETKRSENAGFGEMDAAHAENFVAAIRADDPGLLHAPADVAHRSTLPCHLGNIAHRVGRGLTCDPSTGRILNDEEAMGLWDREYADGWEPVVPA